MRSPAKRGDVDEKAFADSVKAIVRELRVERSGSAWGAATYEEQRVATCLRHIQETMLKASTGNTPEGRTLKRDTDALIEAMIDGHDDPVWFHVRGLRKKHKGRPPLTAAERYRRLTVLGYVAVLKRSGSRQAYRDASETLRSAGIPISVARMQAWDQKADAEARAEVETWASDFLDIASQRGDNAAVVALSFAVENWRSAAEYPGVNAIASS